MENDNDILDLYVPLTFTTGYVFCTQLHRLGNNKAFCNKLYATQSVGRCWNNLWKTKSFYLLESDRLFWNWEETAFNLHFTRVQIMSLWKFLSFYENQTKKELWLFGELVIKRLTWNWPKYKLLMTLIHIQYSK